MTRDTASLITSLDSFEYTFNPKNGQEETISLKTDTQGLLKSGTGASLWDSSLVLSKHLEKSQLINIRTVLELGAGVGLVSAVSAKIFPDAQIIATDQDCCLELLKVNLSKVENVMVECLDWNSGKESCKEILKKFNTSRKCEQGNTQDTSIITLSENDITQISYPDLLLLSDLITWPTLYPSLLSTINTLTGPHTTIIFIHEKRNFEKEVGFFKGLHGLGIGFVDVGMEECDERYRADDIFLFRGRRRLVK